MRAGTFGAWMHCATPIQVASVKHWDSSLLRMRAICVMLSVLIRRSVAAVVVCLPTSRLCRLHDAHIESIESMIDKSVG